MIYKSEKLSKLLRSYPPLKSEEVEQAFCEELSRANLKIVTLDDDPTGVQTVHDISVYTEWTPQAVLEGFKESSPMFYILTNSRSFTVPQTVAAHREMAENIIEASQKTGKEFIIISRGDSTLRGHYPLETEVLRETLEQNGTYRVDGEIIFPFFPEGGRYTVEDVHYVLNGEELIPAGETEFAKDKTFGYKSSDLKAWIEEKTDGACPSENVVSIPLDMLRSRDYAGIRKRLEGLKDFGKMIVNAVDYSDVKVFCTALLAEIKNGKHFVFRTAAAFPKVIGGVSDRPLLTRDDLIDKNNGNGGLIVVGSHVNKTSAQLKKLLEIPELKQVEFNQHLVLEPERFQEEIKRVISLCGESIKDGNTAVLFTRRERLHINSADKEDELRVAVDISNAISSVVAQLEVRPRFIIAKGGITSSDIGVKGLGVKRAVVAGQIRSGIPVWKTGEESKFPGLPYIIFPGNVGTDEDLRDIVKDLIG